MYVNAFDLAQTHINWKRTTRETFEVVQRGLQDLKELFIKKSSPHKELRGLKRGGSSCGIRVIDQDHPLW
jgi:hypothetical protein